MYILGISIDHNSTACLLKDGEIVGCVSEERFSRIKNHWGVPLKAINYLLTSNNIKLSEVDYIAVDDICGINRGNPDKRKQALESITKKSKSQRFLSKIAYNFPRFFDFYYNSVKTYKRNILKNQSRLLIKELSTILNYPERKILIVDHHLAHAFSTCSNLKQKTLVLTLDGQSNEFCSAVSIYDGKNFKIISRSNKKASLGFLYTMITIFLGMRPNEHEFKVMGLAPYAKKDKVNEVYQKFKKIIWLEDLEFKSKFDMFFFENFFEKELKFTRFDNIAGAVQKLVEELTMDWVRNAIKKTGIHNVALCGGVFMNVKANQRILELPEVTNLFVMPSCSDESNAIGSCFYGYKKYCETNNIPFNTQPIKDLYLGPEYGNEYIENIIKTKNLKQKYKIRKIKEINKEVAKLLADGKIVARCSGKSEWGARALGNRSILSNATNMETIKILNETIKDRDFWMPFTPSILDKFAKRYFVNPKGVFAPYMCITFESTKQARKDIPAAMHTYDQTLRPQVVTKEYNPDYYKIIEEFSRLTGRGGILNTSFNLHGEPNVLTPEDAIHTVENSDLKYLAMGNYLFEKLE